MTITLKHIVIHIFKSIFESIATIVYINLNYAKFCALINLEICALYEFDI